MDTFKAGVQYDDFKGTVAADISDNISIGKYLVSIGKAQIDERVVAFRITSGGNVGTPVISVSLVAYLTNAKEFEAAPKKVRAVDVSVTPGEAIAFFKRFDLVAKHDNIDLTDTEVDGPHYP